MAGALARVVGYADGGDVDDDDAGGGYAPDVTAAPDVSPGTGKGPSTDAQGALAALGPALIGSPEEVKGAFTRNQQSYDTAKQRQIDLIRAARDRIPSANGVVDPQLAAAGALLTTGGNFGQGLGAAFNAYGGARQKQYQDELQRAQELGKYDVDEGTAGVQGAEGDFGFLKEQLGLGEKAAQASDIIEQRRQAAADRLQQANLLADERARRDQQANQARQDANQARQDATAERAREADEKAQFSQWVGNDPKSGLPLWANRLGQTRIGDAPIQPKPTGAAASGTALTKNAQFYVDNGIAPDLPSAVTMLREGINSAAGYQKLVQAEKTLLMRNGRVENGEYVGPYTDAQAEQVARDNVKNRVASSRPFTAPFAGPDSAGVAFPGGVAHTKTLTATPPASATPATPGAGAAPATGAAPAAKPVVPPPRPSSVPSGAKYSPSQGKWWWQENGVWKSG